MNEGECGDKWKVTKENMNFDSSFFLLSFVLFALNFRAKSSKEERDKRESFFNDNLSFFLIPPCCIFPKTKVDRIKMYLQI